MLAACPQRLKRSFHNVIGYPFSLVTVVWVHQFLADFCEIQDAGYQRCYFEVVHTEASPVGLLDAIFVLFGFIVDREVVSQSVLPPHIVRVVVRSRYAEL